MQLYAALIASLLMVLWTGLKPNKRTWKMTQFYLMGWANTSVQPPVSNSTQNWSL
jgi:hypothetical protein